MLHLIPLTILMSQLLKKEKRPTFLSYLIANEFLTSVSAIHYETLVVSKYVDKAQILQQCSIYIGSQSKIES